MGLVSGMVKASVAEAVAWADFIGPFRWQQGQHVCLIGPNGSGKTVLQKQLLGYRERRGAFVCFFVTKPTDPELDDLQKRRHYLRVKSNRNWSASSYPRLLLWPEAGKLTDHTEQRRVFKAAMQGMWQNGRWVMVWNELRYLTERLKLRAEVDTLFLQARSSKVTITAETQRPAWVPLEAFSQSAHLFFFSCRDDYDLRRIQGIGAADSRVVRATVESLRQFEFCYVNAINGTVLRSRAPATIGTDRKAG